MSARDPTRPLPSAAKLVALLWLPVATANAALSLAGPGRGSDLAPILGTSACGLVAALLLSTVLTRLTLGRAWTDRLALAGLIVVGSTTVWMVDSVLQQWSAAGGVGAVRWSRFLPVRYNWVYFTLIFALQAALQEGLRTQHRLAQEQQRLVRTQAAGQQALVSALRLQLNPHFVFNTLNTISALVGDERAEDAQRVILRLAAFLRASFEGDPAALITLDEELETVQAYLAIEAVRFGPERLEVRFDCARDLQAALVPPLILQPLVENAIKHAVAPAVSRVTVTLRASRQHGDLHLEVEDDAALAGPRQATPAGAGLGLANTAARLQAHYGERARLEASRGPCGHGARIRLPLEIGDEA